MSSEAPNTMPAGKPAFWPFFILGMAMLLLFFFITKLMVGSSRGITDPEESVRAEARVKNLADLRAEDEKKLTTYAWVDREKGLVQIPISQAMDAVIPVLNQSRPRPAYPVATPTP